MNNRSNAGAMEDFSGTNHDDDRDQSKPVIAKQETQAVRGLRLLVALVLAASMTCVSVGVHKYIKNSEENSLEEAFEQEATKVLESLGYHIYKTMGALDEFTANLVSYAHGTEQAWPFVTIPDVYIRMSKTIRLADIKVLTVYPKVTPEQRAEWENYSIANDHWVDKSLDLMEFDAHYHGPIIREYNVTGTIYGNMGDIPYNTTRNMFPVWMSGPVVPVWPPYNWDMYSVDYNQGAMDQAMGQHAVISAPYMVPDPEDPQQVMEAEYSADWFKDFVAPGENPLEPASDIIYPIIDQLDRVTVDETADGKADSVGLVVAAWYWRDILQNILPNGSDGIVVVFHNPCSANFTYEINGPNVRYMGYGDLHDTDYDDMTISSSLYELDAFSQRESSYSGVEIDKTYCPFTVNVYASSTKRDAYTTSNPAIFTVIVVCIFVFVSLVFIAYDFMVEKRQDKVMTTAVQSTTVVSELFPSNVRDRLYSNKNNVHEQKGKAFIAKKDGVVPGVDKSAPIADLFPETTVFFADISGFTKWSSTRQPTEVFTLLETLYGSFDSIARKRGIFKVETIGDCYMAVCGLPTPNKRHAETMVRFAAECLESMSVLTAELAETMGEDTMDLDFRAGCHSGPTTAGVLRGEKSRFQLFGDTVNTASRMESTGQPGKLQVSEATAQLLMKAGKGHWLTMREDKVEAKGKGSMQTYWCQPTYKAMTANTSTSIFSDAHVSNSSEVEPNNAVGAWLAQQAESRRMVNQEDPKPEPAKTQFEDTDVDC